MNCGILKSVSNIIYYDKNDNKQYNFVPIIDTENGNLCDYKNNKKYDLDDYTTDEIYGKVLIGIKGYNPSGWWKYIMVKKSELKLIE